MFTAVQVLKFAGLPALMAFLILFAVRVAKGSNCHISLGVSGFGLGLGYLLAQTMIIGFPTIPPTEAIHWIYFLVPLSLIFHVFVPPWLAEPKKVLVAILIFWVLAIFALLQTPIQHIWTSYESIAWVLGLSIVGVLCSVGLKFGALSLGAGCSLMIPVTMFFFVGLSVYFAGSWLLAQLCFAFSSTLAIYMVILRLGVVDFEIMCPVQTFFLPIFLILLTGYFYADLPMWSLALFLLVGVPNYLFGKRIDQALGEKAAVHVRHAMLFLPMVVATWVAWQSSI